MKEENGTIIEFLCGEKPFDGVWFSEKHPTENGAFWWRKHLRNYEASRDSRQLSAVPKELVELKQNEYRCKMCLNVYEKEWSDEEALNESKEIFGGDPTVENSDVVCDDCWKKLGFD